MLMQAMLFICLCEWCVCEWFLFCFVLLHREQWIVAEVSAALTSEGSQRMEDLRLQTQGFSHRHCSSEALWPVHVLWSQR